MLTLTLIIGAVLGILWYLHHKLTYWQRKGIPTPGLVYQWRYYTRQLPLYDQELCKKYGPVYGVMEGLKPNLIVSDLDLLKDILVKDFNSFPNHKPFRIGNPIIDLNLFSLDGADDWKRIRSLLSPTFTSGKLRSMEGLINDCVDGLKKNLGVVADSGEVIDAKRYFNSLSFDAIARCGYGTKIDSLNDPHNPIQENFDKVFSARYEFIFSMMFPKLGKLTGISDRAMRPSQFFLSMTKTLIDERTRAFKANPNGKKVYNDFLQTMIEANHEAMKEAAANEGRDSNGTLSSPTAQLKKTVTDDELVAQAFIFLMAGFDTTATIMTGVAYHLAKNPKQQEKLIAEVSDLTELTYDSVMGLKYLEAFLKESFRLSPPVVRVERECAQPTILGNVKVEPGTIVSIPTYVVHRNSTQYKNPEEFDPERFIDGDSVNHHPYAYLPFGGGPRLCLAQRFALMEVKLAFASILKEYRFEATPETKMEFIPASFDILAPKPIMVKVKRH